LGREVLRALQGGNLEETNDHDGRDQYGCGYQRHVRGLLKELPKAGTTWPEAQRKLWLDTAASIFKMIYKDEPAESVVPTWPSKN
jgi:hypothetical protein